MTSTQVRYVGAVGFALMLLFAFGASGWQKKSSHKERVIFTCKDETVTIDPTDGTSPKAIYLCAGKTLTWNANGHQFKVKFRKNSPFVGGKKLFDNNNPTSPPVIGTVALTVYEYDVNVDGKDVDDPQVIGGGGHEDQ